MVVVQLKAADFAQDSIVESGVALANEIVRKLREGEQITVSFEGLRGLSSSYFNPVLLAIKANLGLDVIGQRLNFDFSSSAQQAVFNRSMDAVRKTGTHV